MDTGQSVLFQALVSFPYCSNLGTDLDPNDGKLRRDLCLVEFKFVLKVLFLKSV